jgi:glycosyltransferase involved in cell wall biosynthesis
LHVACTCVGQWLDSDIEARAKKRVRELGLEDRITFAGLLTGGEKWGAYTRAHVLAHPTDLDGQPLTILEAMGMGLAVISTRVGAIPDTIEDGVNGILLPEISGEALYEAIRQLYFDRERLHRTREYNRHDFQKRFALKVYLDHVERWLSEVQGP